MFGRKHLVAFTFKNKTYDGGSHYMRESDYADRSLFLKDYRSCVKDPQIRVSGREYSRRYWNHRTNKWGGR